jgi:polyhydroxyalkanoate synthase
VTFVLTSGGHNAGIVSEPGHKGRRRRILATANDQPYRDPEMWLRDAEARDGSWWPDWTEWLAGLSGDPVKPPAMGAPSLGLPPLEPAPGAYVRRE